jgi:hypothetical protein
MYASHPNSIAKKRKELHGRQSLKWPVFQQQYLVLCTRNWKNVWKGWHLPTNDQCITSVGHMAVVHARIRSVNGAK